MENPKFIPLEKLSETVHPLVTHMVQNHVPIETITILLLFPLIATLVVLLRQVVGLHAFGIYTPSIIAIAFIAMGRNSIGGIQYAIAIYIAVLTIGMIMRYLMQKLRLLYLPRVAITITIVTLSILALLTLAGTFGRIGFAHAELFAILIIITLVEKFVAVQIEKGSRTAFFLALETLVIALIGYFLMSTTTPAGAAITTFILAHPLTILLLIPFHIFLGRWTGLRASEYMRFRDVIDKIQ